MRLNNANKPDARLQRIIAAIHHTPIHRHARRRHLGVLERFSFAAACLISGITSAATPAQEQFAAGNRAYQAQDYRAALEAYDAALAAGQSGPAIHFNIGVTAYRLGEYERARREFTEVARTPSMAALAHYNVGLVELKRANSAAARRWFERARNEAADERLRALTEAQLVQLPAEPERNWVAYGALGLGYDDNVALISNNDVLGVSDEADEFAELTAAVAGPLDRAWGLDASVVATKYQQLEDFDQLIAQGGAHYNFGRGAWVHALNAEVAHTQLGGDGFENRAAVGLQTTTSLPREWSLRLRYRFSDLNGLGGFSGLDGTRHEARARVRKNTQLWDAAVEYGYERSEYRDDALSLNQHKIALSYERAFASDWRAGVDGVLRFSQYKQRSHGTEDRVDFGVALKRQLTPICRVGVRYEYANNDARLAEFDYNRNRLWLGVEATL